ncbi:hypothetical protein C8F04DRAFT_1094966 [Mycena alexandri]|uniref:F-box domain-containing protein n=1 Tax=Mycena alexandri TaxID=1745969 RepID=A0AAD6T2A8_9AGAR|nr:hypothetical protein C8F04DRAFT_1094966 [Mycena alexandri]
MAGNVESSYEEALNFSSPLLPNPQETKHLRDNLRANCLLRETTRLRATVASAPTQLALYRKHINTLSSVEWTCPPDDILPPLDSSARPSTELAIDKALARMRAEYIMLSEYSAICSSSMAPVRRLPPEILIQVFLLFTPATRELNSKDYRGEIHRLIHHDLLQLAQVCAYWRALAFGTPTFWRVLDLDMMFWSHKMLPLAETALERSASSSIQVRIGAPDEVVVDRTLLELIAQHSVRWQVALFYMDFKYFTSLAPIRGNLPLLECAHIAGNLDPDSPELLDLAAAAARLFSDAPRLTDVTYSGPAKGLEHLPWKQLKRFEYLDLNCSDLSDALSALQYFPPGMQFELRRIRFYPWSPVQALLPPPIESDLTDFTVEFAFYAAGGMTEILQRLTLPCLSFLELALLRHKDPPIAWDHITFLRFCARSDCGKTLTTLYLLHVAIATDELLECLAELKALAALVVADHPVVPFRRADPVWLVKDTLFRRLTERAQNTQRHLLVPKLAIFGCLSILRFDEAVYLDFVRSRVEVCPSREFESHVRWYVGSARELKPAVLSELQGLSETRGFVGSIEAANEEEMQTFFY